MTQPGGRTPRLYVQTDLAAGVEFSLGRDQAHYLVKVMRRSPGDPVILFNGRDGEWAARITDADRRSASVSVDDRLRPQAAPPDIHYCFAPLKRARLDFIAQKATELGAALIQPVMTRYTIAERVNVDRLKANAVEAAEQCGILWVPEIHAPVPFDGFLAERDATRTLIFCDEAAPSSNPLEALRNVSSRRLAVLIGPEGGFAEDERAELAKSENVVGVSLGPRIMRADTAGIAALAVVQAVLGDWT